MYFGWKPSVSTMRNRREAVTRSIWPSRARNPSCCACSTVLGARAVARADRRPLAPAQILKALFVEEGKGPRGALVAALVQMLGLYPPGSFVKMENNEMAVIFRPVRAENSQTVAAVTTVTGTPTMQPVRRKPTV